MVNLQRICMVKICEIFQIVEQAFFFEYPFQSFKTADGTFKNGDMVQNSQQVFLKPSGVPVSGCAAPPEMNNNDFYP